MQTTSATWQSLWAAEAPLECRATINSVAYTDIAPVITRGVMQNGLQVGNVVSASCAISMRTGNTIPKSAEVVVEIRLNDGTTASEWLSYGTYYIAKRRRDPLTGVLGLECYDALLKANAVWAPSSGAWPRAMSGVVTELAALLGVSVDARTAIGSGAAYVVDEPVAGSTVRDVLGVIAAANGGNWIITPENKLRLVPVADASDAPDAVADALDVTAVLGEMYTGDTTTITGVRNTVDGLTTITGDETGAVLDVSLSTALALELADAMIGRTYQPYTLTNAVYDPAAEIGDYVRYGNAASILCVESAALGPAFRGRLGAPEPGEMTDEYPYIGATEKALTVAKAYAQEAVETLDDSLTQQDIFNRLTDNGAAQGMVLYNGQLYVNASYINAGQLSANRISGGTLTLGGANDANGVMQVLDASGNVIDEINNLGVLSYAPDALSRALMKSGAFALQVYAFHTGTGQMMWQDQASIKAFGDETLVSSLRGELRLYGYKAITLANRQGAGDVDYGEIDLTDNVLTVTLSDSQSVDGPLTITVSQSGGITISQNVYTEQGTQTLTATYSHLGRLTIPGGLTLGTPLTIANGGTGATDAATALANLGAFPSSGGDVTGDITVKKSSAPRVNIYDASRTVLWYGISSNGLYHGIYSNGYYDSDGVWHSDGHYLIRRNTSGNADIAMPLTVFGNFMPSSDNSFDAGASSARWANVYATTFVGDLNGVLSRRTLFEKGTNPASSQGRDLIRVYGASGTGTGNMIGYAGVTVATNGNNRFYIRAYKNEAGSTANNYIALVANADGTNDYELADPAAFRTAIQAPIDIQLVSGDDTVAEIYAKLSSIPISHSAPFWASVNSIKLLTGNKITFVTKGIVCRISASAFDFIGTGLASGSNLSNLYTWRVSSLTDSAITVGGVYQYTGTAL